MELVMEVPGIDFLEKVSAVVSEFKVGSIGALKKNSDGSVSPLELLRVHQLREERKKKDSMDPRFQRVGFKRLNWE